MKATSIEKPMETYEQEKSMTVTMHGPAAC
jgi:hypothetical protein